MGVNGTPAIYNVDGEYLGGYLTPDELIKRLINNPLQVDEQFIIHLTNKALILLQRFVFQ